jgi:Uncharacterized protein conserved in bacteria (DUF2312)
VKYKDAVISRRRTLEVAPRTEVTPGEEDHEERLTVEEVNVLERFRDLLRQGYPLRHVHEQFLKIDEYRTLIARAWLNSAIRKQRTQHLMGRAGPGNSAGAQLKSTLEHIANLLSEKAAVASDIGDAYAVAKRNGFNVPALRAVVEEMRRGGG